MRKLIILRGPSGSGKTTIANRLQHEECAPYHEADSFFYRSWFLGGQKDEYMFDATKLPQAHRWCQLNVEKHMVEDVPTIIVSNTSMTRWELTPYLKLAEQYGYTVEVWRTPGPWDPELLHKRNTHNVPLATLEKQINKYQPIEGELEWYDMNIFHG